MSWTCSVCGYKYDVTAEKTSFEEQPEDWCCPICGAAKSEFTKDA